MYFVLSANNNSLYVNVRACFKNRIASHTIISNAWTSEIYRDDNSNIVNWWNQLLNVHLFMRIMNCRMREWLTIDRVQLVVNSNNTNETQQFITQTVLVRKYKHQVKYIYEMNDNSVANETQTRTSIDKNKREREHFGVFKNKPDLRPLTSSTHHDSIIRILYLSRSHPSSTSSPITAHCFSTTPTTIIMKTMSVIAFVECIYNSARNTLSRLRIKTLVLVKSTNE